MANNVAAMDYSSLYPSTFFPSAVSVAAKTIGSNLVSVKPMSAPAGQMFYSSFNVVFPWMNKYRNIFNVIHVSIKDTIDNIIEFFEIRQDVILSKVISCKLEGVQFAGKKSEFTDLLGNSEFLKYTLGINGKDLADTYSRLGISMNKTPKETVKEAEDKVIDKSENIVVEAVLYVPLTSFVKEYNIHNVNNFKPTGELANITCKDLITKIYSKKFQKLKREAM